ncbi:hypothetical protein Naga_101907g1 [Nannochloropsis gaditana]|uniref:Uncharacterized protein n=1 Tax=Nannochloropsis gaditana TaxID=72520 RepID=W7THQ7_9STRA|nr:hypothetical protein Naga_101907g1 [Nannochloropsis gaditana]
MIDGRVRWPNRREGERSWGREGRRAEANFGGKWAGKSDRKRVSGITKESSRHSADSCSKWTAEEAFPFFKKHKGKSLRGHKYGAKA